MIQITMNKRTEYNPLKPEKFVDKLRSQQSQNQT
jgi:hypothetical protein